MNKAIFFDKDGTLVENNMYPLAPTDDILPYVIEWLQWISQNTDYKLFIVSNQSFIGKWIMSPLEAESVFRTLLFKFKQYGIIFEEYVYCPHTKSDDCNCRKPKTALVDDLVKKYEIDIENSFVVWDSKSDFLLSENLGANYIQINKDSTTDKPDLSDTRLKYIVNDFRGVVDVFKAPPNFPLSRGGE